MSFRHGSLSFARFRVLGSASSPLPREVDSDLLERLAGNSLRTSGVGEPQQHEFGFCGGRHVFDAEFTPEHNVFDHCLLFGVRVDTNRVPSEIRRAYRAMAEEAYRAEAETGFLSRRERQAAKEDAEERCRRELAEGRYRRSAMIDVLWDLDAGIVYAAAFNDARVSGLRALFEGAFDLQLSPLSSGSLAYEILDSRGRIREYEDARPSVFSPRPASTNATADEAVPRDADRPIVPWTHATSEAGDFLGNEFLLWIMWKCAAAEGIIETDGSDVLLAIDRALDMECAWEVGGRMSLHGSGPARQPEARCGLEFGKWPRKAGLIVAAEGEQFDVNLQADRFICGGVKLPRPTEELASEREIVEHRLNLLKTLDRAVISCYRAFLDTRFSSAWSTDRDRMAAWISSRTKRTAATTSAPAARASVEIKPASELEAAHASTNGEADH